MPTFYEGDVRVTVEQQLTESDFKKIRRVLDGYKTVLITSAAIVLIFFAVDYCLIKAVPDYIAFCISTIVISGLLIWWYLSRSNAIELAYRSNKLLVEPMTISVFRDSFECTNQHITFKGFWSEATMMYESKEFYILLGCREKDVVAIRRTQENQQRLTPFFRETFGRKYHRATWFSGMIR